MVNNTSEQNNIKKKNDIDNNINTSNNRNYSRVLVLLLLLIIQGTIHTSIMCLNFKTPQVPGREAQCIHNYIEFSL